MTSAQVSVFMARKNGGQRSWDKPAKCAFCDKLSTSTNVSKHMLSKHKKECDVQEVLAFPKKSPKRAMLLEKLRNKGNFQHNSAVLKAGVGQIIPWRCPSEPADAKDFSPCEFCLGFFLKKELWRHERTCKFRTTKSKRKNVISRSQMLLPSTASCSD
jgi:hypothetical protein